MRAATGAWILAALLPAARAGAGVFVFSPPSDDRWFYPFSFSPGTRPTASCFGAAGMEGFNDRDGTVILIWDTSAQIPPGLGPENYPVCAVRVRLTNVSGASWMPDLTPDPWYAFDLNQDGVIDGDGIPRGEPGDTDGESSDPDPGRAIELFGVGFGPFTELATWSEFDPYIGSDFTVMAPRDPYPFVFQEGTGAMLHVEDNVKGLWNDGLPEPVFQFTPVPWAVGVPDGDYVPGSQPVPFDVHFDVDLTLSDGRVRDYFRQQLDAGRVAVYVTSLADTVMFGDPNEVPLFFMKEGLFLDPLAQPAQLTIVLAPPADLDGDCTVGPGDLGALLSAWGSAAGEPGFVPPADLDGDGTIGPGDLGALLAAWGAGP